MSVTPDPRQLFTDRHPTYARFIRAMRYRQGLQAFFQTSPLLRPSLRILDAGCGTGALTLAVREAMVGRGFSFRALHAFDLTPAMLDRLRQTMHARRIGDVELAEGDVLHLDSLPPGWSDYDLIVSASMLEYVPRARFVDAIAGLRARLRDRGAFVLFTTRRNPLTRLLIGRWWKANLYTARELTDALQAAGFTDVRRRHFPPAASYLSVWAHIIEGRR